MSEETPDHERSCHVEHDEIQRRLESLHSKIESVDEALVIHDTAVHSEILTRQQVERRDEKLWDTVEELGGEVLGPRISTFGGGGRRVDVGLSARTTRVERKVDDLVSWSNKIDAKLENGGLNARLSDSDRMAIWIPIIVATITTIGTVIAAYLGVLPTLGG